MVARLQITLASSPGVLIRYQGSKGVCIMLIAHTISTHCTISTHAWHTPLAHTACKCRHFCKRHPVYLMLCPHIKAACMYIMATTALAPHQLRRRPASPLMHVSITDAACVLLQWSTCCETMAVAVVQGLMVGPFLDCTWLYFCRHSLLEIERKKNVADSEHMARHMHQLGHASAVMWCLPEEVPRQSMQGGHMLFATSCALPLA